MPGNDPPSTAATVPNYITWECDHCRTPRYISHSGYEPSFPCEKCGNNDWTKVGGQAACNDLRVEELTAGQGGGGF